MLHLATACAALSPAATPTTSDPSQTGKTQDKVHMKRGRFEQSIRPGQEQAICTASVASIEGQFQFLDSFNSELEGSRRGSLELQRRRRRRRQN